jgi:hypothetical protein
MCHASSQGCVGSCDAQRLACVLRCLLQPQSACNYANSLVVGRAATINTISSSSNTSDSMEAYDAKLKKKLKQLDVLVSDQRAGQQAHTSEQHSSGSESSPQQAIASMTNRDYQRSDALLRGIVPAVNPYGRCARWIPQCVLCLLCWVLCCHLPHSYYLVGPGGARAQARSPRARHVLLCCAGITRSTLQRCSSTARSSSGTPQP